MNKENKNAIGALISTQAEIEVQLSLHFEDGLAKAIYKGNLRKYLEESHPSRLDSIFAPLKGYLRQVSDICRLGFLFFDEINNQFITHIETTPHFSQEEQQYSRFVGLYLEAAGQPGQELRAFREFLTSTVFRYKGSKSPLLLSYSANFDLCDVPESYSNWITDPQKGRAFCIDMSPLNCFQGHMEDTYERIKDFIKEKNPRLPSDPQTARGNPHWFKCIEEEIDNLTQVIGPGIFAEQKQKFKDHYELQEDISAEAFMRQLLWSRLLDMSWQFMYILPARILGNQPVGGMAVGSKRPLAFEEFYLFQSLSHRIFSDSALSFARLKAEEAGRIRGWKTLGINFAHNLKNFALTIDSQMRLTADHWQKIHDGERIFHLYSLFANTVISNTLWLRLAGKSTNEPKQSISWGLFFAGIIRSFVRVYDYMSQRIQEELEAPFHRFIQDTQFVPPVLEFSFHDATDRVGDGSYYITTTTYQVRRMNNEICVEGPSYYMQTAEENLQFVQNGLTNLQQRFEKSPFILDRAYRDELLREEFTAWRGILPYLGSILPGVAVWSLDSPIGLSLLEDFDVGFDEIFYNAMRYGVVQNLPLHITCRFTISESNFVRMTISNKVLISQLKRDLKEKSIDHPTESGVLGIRAFWERMGFSVKDTYEELVRSWEMGEEQFEYYVCLEGNGLLTN